MSESDCLLHTEDGISGSGRIIAGVDEAGRGCLAGPVVAGAVILDENRPIHGLRDSKALSEKRRNELFEQIREKALAYSVGMTAAEEIDRINILRAALLAMEKAVLSLGRKPDFLLIDGNSKTSLPIRQKAIIKGDSKCASIAAASIVAKVTRDRMMTEIEREYPGYGFSRHKGYPTKEHLGALRNLGPCPIHRKSFKGVL
ncbi:MAG: ribonuclease HII [Candidatus Dadabacteria bacterium]|nr:ribonuclease HII [Candidatus Dadabacteria bacterium]MDE0158961.1 ribonuclease HII [Candidatus Dadabacteria bacterium]MDE0291823.1 ribonuclease HII [Candidatus Dadabacteria bacterium]MDE0477623.1 ribonuclease HII [Candidatus Dadabacteria bacterium]